MGRVVSLGVVVIALAAPLSAAAFVPISRAGCEPGRAAAWKVLPSPYHIWHEGYSHLSMDEIEEIIHRAANKWGEPCCSNFSAEYRGLTDVQQYGNPEQNVISFIESEWPRAWGHPYVTIAVTVPDIRSCEIRRADIIFNGTRFRFRTDGRSTDLEAIAVHEFGHWIGLDHTTVRGATMLPYYQGGTAGRDPNWDDQAGACYLYPTPCPCDTAADCKSHEVCEDAFCAGKPCETKTDCPEGSTCKEGRCTEGCKFHEDCEPGDWCIDGRCVERFTECTICQRCNADHECGDPARGYRCHGPPNGVCVKGCETDQDCPGDSVCLSDWSVCGSPDASPAWPCDPSYECEFSRERCTAVGQACSHPDGCGGSSDICVDIEGEATCSCTCLLDQDCGEGAVCVQAPDTRHRACYPVDAVEACGAFYCPPGLKCIPGEARCGLDLCEGVQCPEGLVCRFGECVDPCADIVCREGYVCQGGSCVQVEKPASQGSSTAKKKRSGCAAAGADADGLALLGLLATALYVGFRRP